jgi:trans-aconitate methyltransferase
MDDADRRNAFYRGQVEKGLYQDFAGSTDVEAVAFLLRGKPAAKRVLDLGCGNGDVAERLLADGIARSFRGIEAFPELVAKAKERAPGAEIVQADVADRSAWGSEPFHAVLCLFLFQDMRPDQMCALLQAAKGALSDGGHLLVGLRVIPEPSREMNDYTLRKVDGIPTKYAFTWNREEFGRALSQAGFLPVRSYEEPRPSPPNSADIYWLLQWIGRA